MTVDKDIAEIQDKLDSVLTILKGGHDATGKFYPGLSPRLDAIESRVNKLEDENARAEDGRLTLARGAGIALFGGVVAQAFNWFRDHLK